MQVIKVSPTEFVMASVSSIPHEPGGACLELDGFLQEVPVNVVEYLGHVYQFANGDVQGNVAQAFDVGTAEPVCLVFPEPW